MNPAEYRHTRPLRAHGFRARKVLLACAALAVAALCSGATAFAVPVIGTSFTGSTFGVDSGFIPPDSMGAVGVDHFVELINGRYSVYDKQTGTRVQTSTLDAFWSNAGVSVNNFSFDPRVLYDPASSRWFAAAVDNSHNPNNFLFAVSQSADPTQGWSGFAIDSDTADTRWADFPTLGVDADGVYLAANMFGVTTSFATDVTLLSIPKSDLLSATPTIDNRTTFELAGIAERGFSLQPVVDFGPSDGRAAILAVDDRFSFLLRRSDILGADASGATLSDALGITVLPTSFPPDALQPDGSANLDTGDRRFSSSVFELDDSLWAAHTTRFDGRSAIRWYEIDEPTSTVLQVGTIVDPTLDLFFPSIAANAYGDVVIGASGAGLGPGGFASSYALVGSTLGGVTTFESPLLLQAGVANYEILDGSGRNRWGDYSAVTIDPTDPYSFWTIQEWASGDDVWSTQVTQLTVGPAIPEPGTIVLFGSGLGVWGLRRLRRLTTPSKLL